LVPTEDTMTDKSDRLGQFIKSHLDRDMSGIDVSSKTLADCDIDVDKVEYSDWLSKYGLRIACERKGITTFIKRPF
jgi:hypothetical protein